MGVIERRTAGCGFSCHGTAHRGGLGGIVGSASQKGNALTGRAPGRGKACQDRSPVGQCLPAPADWPGCHIPGGAGSMLLRRIAISNFKSLKNVEIRPSGLTTLIGPNGAGKMNFVMALKFLSEVHQHGLETAIARAGGIENIALRKQRRSKSPIAFDVELSLGADDLIPLWELVGGKRQFTVQHGFACRASGTGIRADFSVVEETLRVWAMSQAGRPIRLQALMLEVIRGPGGGIEVSWDPPSALRGGELDRLARRMGVLGRGKAELGQQELLVTSAYVRTPFLWRFLGSLGRVGVYHFSPDRMRESGTPTPNPTLSIGGSNLPALVDWLQRKRKSDWNAVLKGMRDIVPGLTDIRVDILPSKTLGIFFVEEGVGPPWRVDEVSDGTIHVLSMLVAAADPRVSALVIDEPERSLHPWIVKELGKKLRAVAQKKTVILTTQSPVVIDVLDPSEAWVVSRQAGGTSIRRLTDLDRSLEGQWREGNVGLSEYLDAGLVPRAVPGGTEA